MASLVRIKQSTELGSEVLTAVSEINAGLGRLRRLNGRRAQLIGAGATIFARQAGVVNAQGEVAGPDGQALNDRWATLISQMDAGSLTVLTDLLDATIQYVATPAEE